MFCILVDLMHSDWLGASDVGRIADNRNLPALALDTNPSIPLMCLDSFDSLSSASPY